MTSVLDASALLAYLEGAPGCERVKKAITLAAESGNALLMSVVNWGEVYYVLIRRFGLEKAEQAVALLETLPIDLIAADQVVTRQASRYKALHKLPYADSFAAALAKIRRAELITGDQEFRAVGGDIKITWL